MTDLDPGIWDNPTLGAAAQNENLDRLTKQEQEDRSAKIENREPRNVVVDNTYPGWKPEVSAKTDTVPSNYQTVHFEDEQQADIPVDSGPEDETASGISDGSEEASSSENGEGMDTVSSEHDSEVSVPENSTPESDSTQEGNTTQWT